MSFDWNTVTTGIEFLKQLNRLESDIKTIKQLTETFAGAKTFNDDVTLKKNVLGTSVDDEASITTLNAGDININNVNTTNVRVLDGSTDKTTTIKDAANDTIHAKWADNDFEPLYNNIPLSANYFNGVATFAGKYVIDTFVHAVVVGVDRAAFNTRYTLPFAPIGKFIAPTTGTAQIEILMLAKELSTTRSVDFTLGFYVGGVQQFTYPLSNNPNPNPFLGVKKLSDGSLLWEFEIGVNNNVTIKLESISVTPVGESSRVDITITARRANNQISAGNPIRVLNSDYSGYDPPRALLRDDFNKGRLTD